MHRFVVAETILALLPAIITLAGLVLWWRRLGHRTLFAVTGYLSLVAIYSTLHRRVRPAIQDHSRRFRLAPPDQLVVTADPA